MRFDYQPALINTKILKTSKQRKLFLLASAGIVGGLIIISSVLRTIIKYGNEHKTYIYTRSKKILPFVAETATASALEVSYQPASLQFNAQPLEKVLGADLQLEPKAESLLNNKNTTADLKWKTVKVQPGDTLIGILQHLEVPAIYLKDLNNFIKTNVDCRAAYNLKSGFAIKILFDQDRNLRSIKLPIAAHKTLSIDQIGPRNYKVHYEEKPIIKKLTFARNKIAGSFYAAAQSAGLNEKLIMEMADLFGWDIDFGMDIRPNDKFRILYEEHFVDNEKISTGNILVAEFVNQGQLYRAIRFTDHKGRDGYYTPEGYSMSKTFLRNPVKFTRIGSRFSSSRRHPILHRIRAHKGVDYVAPAGTPVKAAGDGRVILIGKKGGYGNVIELLHGNKYSTLYAHLSNFAAGIRKDQVVKQGQIIGYVGRTGLATGDHLHYEFRVDGVHRDPLTVQFPKSLALSNRYRTKFLSHAEQMLSLLNENDTAKF